MTNKIELMVKKDGWPVEEKTTRNCYHCLTPTSGVFVTCRKGHYLEIQKGGLRFNSVVGYARLYACCEKCLDFDNDWREGG